MWNALLFFSIKPENNVESENREQQQQLNSQPTSNWYIGRRPRTAFTTSQVISLSTSSSIILFNYDTVIMTSIYYRRKYSFFFWVNIIMCILPGEYTGDSVSGELLSWYSAEGTAGRETRLGWGQNTGSFIQNIEKLNVLPLHVCHSLPLLLLHLISGPSDCAFPLKLLRFHPSNCLQVLQVSCEV